MCACGMCCCCCYAMLSNKICMPFLTTTHDSRYGQNSAPPKKASGRRNCGAGPRASERTTVAAHARPDPYLRRRRPPSQTPISRRASVLVVRTGPYCVLALGPTTLHATSAAPRRLLGAAAHAARASKPRRAQSGRAHRRPRHRGSPPGAERMLSGSGTMGVVSVILAVGPRIVQRPPGVRGPLSTFLSRRCALSVHRVHAPCPRH